MFSLIITIISIALVAALALATLYYGGSAFNKGSAEATASKVMLQGQQLLGAADLYYAEHNVWPSMQQLLDDEYLKSVPVGQVPGTVAAAYAAGVPWTMPIEGEPVFMLALPQQEDACAAVNNKGSLHKPGILEKAYTELNAQCYGKSGNFKVIFKKFGGEFSLRDLDDGVVDIPTIDVVPGAAPISDTDPAWSKRPVAPGSPTGGLPVVAAPEGLQFQTVAIPAALVNESVAHSATITNTSGYPVTLTTFSVSNPAFSVAPGTCANLLEAGASCEVSITFAPTTGDAYTTDLLVGGTFESGTFELSTTFAGTGSTIAYRTWWGADSCSGRSWPAGDTGWQADGMVVWNMYSSVNKGCGYGQRINPRWQPGWNYVLFDVTDQFGYVTQSGAKLTLVTEAR